MTELNKVSIDVEVHVTDPKQARTVALEEGRVAFDPGPRDRLAVTYLSDGEPRPGGWHFTATVTWTASPDGVYLPPPAR